MLGDPMADVMERRTAPRLSVKARCAAKRNGALVQMDLSDISPSGARLVTREEFAVGDVVKLYLRSGRALDATVARRTSDGFAVAFADDAPTAMPHKTFFWKLESYAFASGDYTPAKRTAHGRHLSNDALVEDCTVLDWTEGTARIDTPVRLVLGTEIHLCGRRHKAVAKRGSVYDLEAIAA